MKCNEILKERRIRYFNCCCWLATIYSQYKRSENGFLISKSGSGSNSWIPAAKDPAGFAVTDTDTELQSYPALFFWGQVVYYWTCQHHNHLWRLSGLLLFFFLNILFPFVSHPSPTQPCMETHCEKISPLSWLLWCLDRFISPARSVFSWLLIVECRRRWEVKAGSVFMSGWESESGAVSRTNRDAGLQLIVWRDKCPMRSTRRKRIWIYLKACGCDLKGNRNRKQQVYTF